ncbi:zinc finger protein 1, partial [Aphis craccivora]
MTRELIRIFLRNAIIILASTMKPGGSTSLIIVAEDDSRFAPGGDDAYYRNDPVKMSHQSIKNENGIYLDIPPLSSVKEEVHQYLDNGDGDQPFLID